MMNSDHIGIYGRKIFFVLLIYALMLDASEIFDRLHLYVLKSTAF